MSTVKALVAQLQAGLVTCALTDKELQLLLREATEDELYQARLHVPTVDARAHSEIHARMKALRESRLDGYTIGEWVEVPIPR